MDKQLQLSEVGKAPFETLCMLLSCTNDLAQQLKQPALVRLVY